jgi:hypothetical protein
MPRQDRARGLILDHAGKSFPDESEKAAGIPQAYGPVSRSRDALRDRMGRQSRHLGRFVTEQTVSERAAAAVGVYGIAPDRAGAEGVRLLDYANTELQKVPEPTHPVCRQQRSHSARPAANDEKMEILHCSVTTTFEAQLQSLMSFPGKTVCCVTDQDAPTVAAHK